jgi:hypothetical protein
MSRCTAANSAGDFRPTASQIIDDEDLENKLPDNVMLITGFSQA